MHEYYEIRIYENVWTHTLKFNFKTQIQFEDNIYKHIHRDNNVCWLLML